jgi:hypothetical protein
MEEKRIFLRHPSTFLPPFLVSICHLEHPMAVTLGVQAQLVKLAGMD